MKYTKEQIDSMTPEQLKRAVGTEVMGHKLGWYTDYGFKKEYEREVIALENGRYEFIPNYSTDISAAWEVVDTLKIAVIPQSEGAPNNLKYLAIIEKDFKQEEFQAFASTAPEAICKVALLAVME